MKNMATPNGQIDIISYDEIDIGVLFDKETNLFNFFVNKDHKLEIPGKEYVILKLKNGTEIKIAVSIQN